MVFYDFLFHAVSYESNLAFTKLAKLFLILVLYEESIFDCDANWLLESNGGKDHCEVVHSINKVFFWKRHRGVKLHWEITIYD